MKTPACLDVDTGNTPCARTAQGKMTAKFMVIGCNAYLGKTVQSSGGPGHARDQLHHHHRASWAKRGPRA